MLVNSWNVESIVFQTKPPKFTARPICPNCPAFWASISAINRGLGIAKLLWQLLSPGLHHLTPNPGMVPGLVVPLMMHTMGRRTDMEVLGDRYSLPMPVSWDERDQQQHRIPLGILENVGVQGTCNLLWRQQAHNCNTPGHQGKSRSQWPQVCPSPLLEWEKNWKLPWDLSRILKSAKREVS